MKFSQAFKLAWQCILGSKMRSFLTMLGMIIGVASVITLVGLMQGATNYMLGEFSDMGTNMVTVSVNNTDTRNVNPDQMYQYVEENSHIFEAVTPDVTRRYTIKNGNDSITTLVFGVGEDYLDMNRLSLSSGRFISYADIKNRYNGCIVGTYIIEELFGGSVTLGDTIRINGQIYTIIGIQEEKSDSKANTADDRIYIPYSNATRLAGSSDIGSYTFAVVDTENMEQAEDILDNYFYDIYKDEDLYSISSLTELLKSINMMTGILSSMLGGIASISLLVAGIGIMNIMLVSVVERTKEIGIRKALGAKRKDIMWQFVIEAASISMLGGFMGIVIGYVATTTLGKAFGMEAAPTLNSILLAFGVSAAIGIGFGYMPANKAAKLNPIDALRSE